MPAPAVCEVPNATPQNPVPPKLLTVLVPETSAPVDINETFPEFPLRLYKVTVGEFVLFGTRKLNPVEKAVVVKQTPILVAPIPKLASGNAVLS